MHERLIYVRALLRSDTIKKGRKVNTYPIPSRPVMLRPTANPIAAATAIRNQLRKPDFNMTMYLSMMIYLHPMRTGKIPVPNLPREFRPNVGRPKFIIVRLIG